MMCHVEIISTRVLIVSVKQPSSQRVWTEFKHKRHLRLRTGFLSFLAIYHRKHIWSIGIYPRIKTSLKQKESVLILWRNYMVLTFLCWKGFKKNDANLFANFSKLEKVPQGWIVTIAAGVTGGRPAPTLRLPTVVEQVTGLHHPSAHLLQPPADTDVRRYWWLLK